MHSPEGPRALFIYYRVTQTRSAEAFQAITTLQQGLMQNLPGLQAKLWRRTHEQGGEAIEQTWMEVYEHPQGVDAQREQCLLALVQDLPHDLIGVRHLEAFVPLGVAAGHPFKPEA